jgi:hypothetical protein
LNGDSPRRDRNENHSDAVFGLKKAELCILHENYNSLDNILQVKDKVVPVFLTEHHAMKAYWGSGSIAPRILDLGTRSG